MPKIRDLGINALPIGKYPAGGWRLDGGCPGKSPAPCPSSSPTPCPGASPAPCPGASPTPCPGASPAPCPSSSPLDPGCSDRPRDKYKKASGLSADAIAQLRQHLDHAVTSKFTQ